jgi:hypothetical protein
MKKQLIFTALVLLFNINLMSQVGIGTSNPTHDLEVVSPDLNAEILLKGRNEAQLLIDATHPVIQLMTGGSPQASIVYNSMLMFYASDYDITQLPVMTMINDGKRKVGINNSFVKPDQTLTVNGKIKIGNDDNPENPGTMRYHNGEFSGYDGSEWISLQKDLVDADKDSRIMLVESSRDKIQFISGIYDTMEYNGETINLTGTSTIIGSDVSYISTPNNLNNTFIGREAGLGHGRGSNNVYLGAHAGTGPYQGVANTFIGAYSGENSASTNFGNTLLGCYSGEGGLGNKNIFLGYKTGSYNNGDGNIYIGEETGYGYTENNMFRIGSPVAQNFLVGDLDNKELEIDGQLSLDGDLTTEGIDIVDPVSHILKYQIGYDAAINKLMIKNEAGEEVIKIVGNEVYLPTEIGFRNRNLCIDPNGKIIAEPDKYEFQVSPYDFNVKNNFIDRYTYVIDEDLLKNHETFDYMSIYHKIAEGSFQMSLHRIPKDPFVNSYSFQNINIFHLSVGDNNSGFVKLYTDTTPTSNRHIIDTDNYIYMLYTDYDIDKITYVKLGLR